MPDESNHDGATSCSAETAAHNRIKNMYNLKKFQESDMSKIKKSFHSCKLDISHKIKDPKTYTNFLFNKLPFLSWLPKYNLREYLVLDLIAGITVGVMNIPQVF